MTMVRIVGGGLTGILAAFEAHRLGCRDIELHERFDALGGVALPAQRMGLELRDGCVYFGGPDDPIRAAFERHGLRFDEFDNRFGSVSPGPDGGLVYTEDFGGPALACTQTTLAPPAGDSLADRIGAYPPAIAEPLARYARWHLGHDLSEVHGEAAIPLGINRVYPLGADIAALAQAKRTDPLADELYAIPRTLWGRTANLRASLPRGGFRAFFTETRRVLEGLGVRIHEETLVSPRAALAEHRPGDALVWAANPTPLFKAAGVPTPKLLPKTFATYVFAARWTRGRPFYVQNFTGEGACFRVYLYESGGRTLLAAECVREASEAELRAEVGRLLEGFPGIIGLGEPLNVSVQPRWIYHSRDAIRRLAELRATLAARMGADFVPGAWEPYSKAEKLAQVNAGLAAALRVEAKAAAA